MVGRSGALGSVAAPPATEARGQPLTPAILCRGAPPPSQEPGKLAPFREEVGAEAESGLPAREALAGLWVFPFSGEGAGRAAAPSQQLGLHRGGGCPSERQMPGGSHRKAVASGPLPAGSGSPWPAGPLVSARVARAGEGAALAPPHVSALPSFALTRAPLPARCSVDTGGCRSRSQGDHSRLPSLPLLPRLRAAEPTPHVPSSPSSGPFVLWVCLFWAQRFLTHSLLGLVFPSSSPACWVRPAS